MGLTVTIIVLIISGVALGVAGGFGTDATAKVEQLPAYSTNEDLQNAHGLMVTASVLTWVSLGLLVLVLVLFFVYQYRNKKKESSVPKLQGKKQPKWYINIALFLLLGITVTTGILWILGSNGITTGLGDNTDADNGTIWRTQLAGGLALGTGLLTLILFIAFLVYKSPTGEKLIAQRKLARKQKRREAANIEAQAKAIDIEAKAKRDIALSELEEKTVSERIEAAEGKLEQLERLKQLEGRAKELEASTDITG